MQVGVAWFGWSAILWSVEIVEYQGLRMTREAAEIAEREGIDVWLIKRNLSLTPLERLERHAGTLPLQQAIKESVIRDER